MFLSHKKDSDMRKSVSYVCSCEMDLEHQTFPMLFGRESTDIALQVLNSEKRGLEYIKCTGCTLYFWWTSVLEFESVNPCRAYCAYLDLTCYLFNHVPGYHKGVSPCCAGLCCTLLSVLRGSREVLSSQNNITCWYSVFIITLLLRDE